MKISIICLTVALLAVGFVAAKTAEASAYDCTSNSWGVPTAGGWTLNCPGACPVEETCDHGDWTEVEPGVESLQCACTDGQGWVTYVADGAECVPWLERTWDVELEVWIYQLQCSSYTCKKECDDRQVSGPKWECYCPD